MPGNPYLPVQLILKGKKKMTRVSLPSRKDGVLLFDTLKKINKKLFSFFFPPIICVYYSCISLLFLANNKCSQ